MQPSSFPQGTNQACRRAICFAGVLAVGLSYAQAAQAEESTPASIVVHVEQGLLSIDVRNAPLGNVLEAIAKQASFRLETKGDLDTPVTWSFANVPVDRGIQRLLRNISSVMLYAPSDAGKTGHLVAIHTLRRKTDRANDSTRVARTFPPPPIHQTTDAEGSQPRPTVNLDDDRGDRLRAVRRLIRKPNAASVKDLALLLSQDEDPVIRRIAASGLGKLRVPEVRAALREALSDEDSLVRRRAIQGLGKAWGHEAVEPLSEALVGDPEPSNRRQAALRLGRIFSEEAYQVLDAARFDTDFSVRQAVLAGLARLEDM
jgi:hypothetical protein